MRWSIFSFLILCLTISAYHDGKTKFTDAELKIFLRQKFPKGSVEWMHQGAELNSSEEFLSMKNNLTDVEIQKSRGDDTNRTKRHFAWFEICMIN